MIKKTRWMLIVLLVMVGLMVACAPPTSPTSEPLELNDAEAQSLPVNENEPPPIDSDGAQLEPGDPPPPEPGEEGQPLPPPDGDEPPPPPPGDADELPPPPPTLDPTDCTETNPHPVGEGIAETYDVTYEEVMTYFCEGASFDDILLAYETIIQVDADLDDLLARRADGESWDAIWQDLGLTD